MAGVDPAEYVKKYSDRAPVVHLKDFVMGKSEKPDKMYELIGIDSDKKEEEEEEEVFGFRPLGHGIQNFPPFSLQLKKQGRVACSGTR